VAIAAAGSVCTGAVLHPISATLNVITNAFFMFQALYLVISIVDYQNATAFLNS
jgi:hypothetical protein